MGGACSLGEPQATRSPCARRRYCLDTSFCFGPMEDASGQAYPSVSLHTVKVCRECAQLIQGARSGMGVQGETVSASAYILLQSGHVNGKKSSAAQPGTVQCSPTWEGA